MGTARAIMAFLWLGALSAVAGVYADRDALLAKFGTQKSSEADPKGIADKVAFFEKDGVQIKVWMLRGKAVKLLYTKAEFYKEPEVKALLEANAQGHIWLRDQKKKYDVRDSLFVRDDRKVDARVKWNEMVFVTNDFYNALRAKKEREGEGIAPKLKDF